MSLEAGSGLPPLLGHQASAPGAHASGVNPYAPFLSCCRYGVWGDWERPYLTLEPKYEAAQLRIFGKLVAAGHIYRGTKPVHWSPSSQTALAEAELEYPDGHTSRSIYVAMPLESIGRRRTMYPLP